MPLELKTEPPPTRALTGWRPPEAADVSSAVQEVLGRTPPWILRSGMTVLAGAVGLLLFLSWLIHYPDTVRGKIVITGTNPSVAVMARQSGRLERLQVAEGERVKKGHLLGIINNAADTDSMLRLRKEIQKLRGFLVDPAAFAPLDLSGEAQLGSVQNAYTEFNARYRLYDAMLHDDHVEKAVALLQSQVARQQKQRSHMERQSTFAGLEGALALENMERMQKLHAQKAISTSELDTQERQFLEQKRQQSMAEKAIIEQEIAASEYEKQIRELTHKRKEDLRSAATDLAGSLKKLLNDIEIWENDFVLRAPSDGVVAFYDFWADQQFVTQGKAVFIIAPEASALLGRMPIQQGGAGKVKAGQPVRIKLDDFPSKEFGLVSGRVKSVSLVAQQGQQLVSVDLDFPLKSSYGRTINFKQEMTGDAMVITDDRRLIERLFGELRRAYTQPAG